MRNIYYYLIFCAIFLLCVSSCSKKIIPSSIIEKDEKSFNNESFNRIYVEAIKLKLMGNEGEALKYFEYCIKMNPKSDASYYQMAQILISKGDIINGKCYSKKAYLLDQENAWYIIMLSGIYYQEKNLDSAIYYCEKAVKKFPDKQNLKLTLGNLYSENSKFDKANEIFQSLDIKYGVNEASTISTIKNLMAEKKFDEALLKAQLLKNEYPDKIVYNMIIAEIYQGKGENDKAFEVYNEILDKNPNDPEILLPLCNLLINQNRYNELFMILKKIALNGDVKIEELIPLFTNMIEIPEIVNERGNEFILTIMILEANHKENDIILLLRPEVLIKQNKLREASIRLEEIINRKRGNYYAWEKLLLVYMQMGDYDKLMEKGEECSILFNTSFIAKLLYADAAMQKEKYSIALEELRKAEILADDDKDLLIQVLTMRADVYYRMKEFGKAFEIYEKAIKTDNKDLTILNNYAYYLAEQNIKLKEAEEMAEKVIEKEKENTTFMDTYAWVLYKRGKLNDAEKVMEEILKKGEKPDAEWYEHYGFILKKQKKCIKAIEMWNIAIKVDSTKIHLIKEIENCKK